MATTPSSTSEHLIRRALGAYAPRRAASGSLQRAAVLVPIVMTSPGPEILFIVRPTTLSSHSGQVAFPGGRIDPEDADPVGAALREAEEELGIDRALPEVIGALDDLPTHTGYHVAPVVALLRDPLALEPSAGEVASVFRVPLSRLDDPREQRTLRGHRRGGGAWPRAELRLHFWVHTPAPIWGVTGQILVNLLSVLRSPGAGA